MIIFQLICDNGHEFEGWFHGHEAFQEQLDQGLIHCPACDSSRVHQHLATGGKLRNRQLGSPDNNLYALARTLRRVIETHFEDVGPDFAQKALQMHYGVEEERSIRGSTTDAEEEMLKEEGVAFVKVPLPDIPGDSDLN